MLTKETVQEVRDFISLGLKMEREKINKVKALLPQLSGYAVKKLKYLEEILGIAKKIFNEDFGDDLVTQEYMHDIIFCLSRTFSPDRAREVGQLFYNDKIAKEIFKIIAKGGEREIKH